MGKSSGLGTFHVLPTIVIERAFDLAFAAGLLLATLPLAIGAAWAKPVAILTLVLVIAGLVALYLVARNSQFVEAWLNRIGKKWGFIERQVLPRIGSLIRGLGSLTRPSQFFLSLFWIFLSWAIWLATFYVMLLCIAPSAPLWWAAFVEGVLALGVAIPSAPSALGVYEATMVAGLSILGIDPSTGLAFAIFMHFMNFAQTGVFGFIGLFKDGRSLGSLFSEIQLWNQTKSSEHPVE
jgi:glycosyltransferase 2 family protein